MANTFFMNNGEETWIFTIDGDAAKVEKANDHGVIITEKGITTREEARKFWALGFSLSSTMRKESVMPTSCIIYPEYAYIQDEADQPLPFAVA